MAATDRTIGVLKLFTLKKSAWTVEDAAVTLGVSASSAYRYFSKLTEAGFLVTVESGIYSLGPAIIQYDRQIQLTDPLLRVAKPVMAELTCMAPANSVVLLCRIFRETVLCVHQEIKANGQVRVSYERGRPMPLFKGATSKVILAHMSSRDLRHIFELRRAEIQAAHLGESWNEFRHAMNQLRKNGHDVTYSEVDSERIGIASPILGDQGRILGSLSFVIVASETHNVSNLVHRVQMGAREIEQRMRLEPEAHGGDPSQSGS